MGPLELAHDHLRKSQEFLLAAEANFNQEFYNAATSDAVISGINAKDAICLKLTGRTSKSDDHAAAVEDLKASGRVGAALGPTLSRLLALKTRSQYQSMSIAASQARQFVDKARKLFQEAKPIVELQ